MQPQTIQIILVIALVIVVICAYYILVLRRERDKYLFKLKPIESEKNRLEEEVNRLKLKANEPISLPSKSKKDKKSGKKDAAQPNKQPAATDPTELNEKIQSLKAEVSKLREQNYSLSQDNKSLRKDIKAENAADQDEQREVVTLRESEHALRDAVESANARIAELEKQLQAARTETKENTTETAEPQSAASENTDSEKIATLTRENESLKATLKDVRGELASFKRDFKNELDNAKKEVADSNRALRKEAADAQRQMQQSKKRADNNHKLYLIARAQTLLAQKKLAIHEPDYKPSIALPTSNDAIEETVKKFIAFEARENRATDEVNKLGEKVRQLETENTQLRSQVAAQPTLNSLETSFNLQDDSLTDLVNAFNETAAVSITDAPTMVTTEEKPTDEKRTDSGSLTALLSGIDDGWDSL